MSAFDDAPTPARGLAFPPRDPGDVRSQTPKEHAADIIDCWLEVGLLVSGHRSLSDYQNALAVDIQVAEERGEARARATQDGGR